MWRSRGASRAGSETFHGASESRDMNSVAKFFLLTYALAWTFFGAGVITRQYAVFLPGVFAPAIVALVLTPRGGASVDVAAGGAVAR